MREFLSCYLSSCMCMQVLRLKEYRCLRCVVLIDDIVISPVLYYVYIVCQSMTMFTLRSGDVASKDRHAIVQCKSHPGLVRVVAPDGFESYKNVGGIGIEPSIISYSSNQYVIPPNQEFKPEGK